MYPEPYFDKQILSKEHKEIKKTGFVVDTILAHDPNMSVYGLNITMGWPLPISLNSYEMLYRELMVLSSENAYVYPYAQTHMTLMTLVNFKKNRYPNEKTECIKTLVPEIISSSCLEAGLKPFMINIGPPVLLKSAAILPVLNFTREVLRLREKIAPLLNKAFSLKAEVPQNIHSTILRFLKNPSDTNAFIKKFESLAKNKIIGQAVINELSLTLETKPYMRDGINLHRFSLT